MNGCHLTGEGSAQVPASDSDRSKWLGETRKGGSDANPYREKLIELYGKERG